MIEFSVKMEAPSTPNLREHHMVRAKRVKKQRAAVTRKMPKWVEGPLLVVRLTRIAPRELDSDNVQGAMKGVRDAVAARLRIDDASPLVRWEYAQAKGEAAVVVQVLKEGEDGRVPPVLPTVTADAGKRLRVVREAGAGRIRAPRSSYIPPRGAGVGAAKEADETLAPHGQCDCVGERHSLECAQDGCL